jgi:transcriptional regulator with XRE-family HTH domain
MITKYDELMTDPEFRKEMAIETLVAEAAELVAQLMAEQNLSKADLARRLNKSRAWVTQLLSGNANMTVRTLAEVTYTLGAEIKLQSQSFAKSSASPDRGTWKPIQGDMGYYVLHTGNGLFELLAAASTTPSQVENAEEYAA